MKATMLTKETITHLGVTNRTFPAFRVGDTIAVSQFVKEGNKERVQVFQGDVIAMRGSGVSQMFTVRRICANNIAVERIFPYYAPFIKSIKLLKRGDVRRAKLYYVRDRIGKAARIREKVLTKEQKLSLNKRSEVENVHEQVSADAEQGAQAIQEPSKATKE